MNFKNGQLLYEDSNLPILKDNVKNHVVMQYIGIKDKDGVEIYEGDIVKYRYFFCNNDFNTLEKFIDKKEIIGQIFINEFGNGIMNNKKKYYFYDLTKPFIRKVKIIGNIYENPELLKEEQYE